jgi:hypothetical protein
MILALWKWVTTLSPSEMLLLILIVVTGVSSSLFAYLLEKRTKPALKFGRISKNDEPAYFVNIIKKKGQVKAKSCEGWLDVENTVRHAPTVWAHENQRLYDIGDFMALRLFRLSQDNTSIFFPAANITQGYIDNEHPLEQFRNRILKITVNMDNGRSIYYQKTIMEIIEEGNRP